MYNKSNLVKNTNGHEILKNQTLNKNLLSTFSYYNYKFTTKYQKCTIKSQNLTNPLINQATASIGLTASPLISQDDEILDFNPNLSFLQNIGIILLAAAVPAGLTYVIKPISNLYIYFISGIVIFLCSYLIIRAIVIESIYNSMLRDPYDLKDLDSKFQDIDDVNVHYKISTPSKLRSNPFSGIHLYHGFGINLNTWKRVQNRLSKTLDTFVTSHDITGFGLTSRPKSYSKYSLDNSAKLGLKVLKYAIKNHLKHNNTQLLGNQLNCKRSGNEMIIEGIRPREKDNKYVLVGHSMGCACAIREAVRNPKEIYRLILVAPPLTLPKIIHDDNNQIKKNVIIRIYNTIMIMIKIMIRLIIIGLEWLLQPIIIYNLKIRIRKRSFWNNGLPFAYYVKEPIQNAINLYMKPSLVKGSAQGLVKFQMKSLFNFEYYEKLKEAITGIPRKSMTDKLIDILQNPEYDIKVLIINGKEDKVVRLERSKNIKEGSKEIEMIEWEECGHMPQEEYPEKLVDEISRFVKYKYREV